MTLFVRRLTAMSAALSKESLSIAADDYDGRWLEEIVQPD